jgi:hypothetical protein
MNRNATLTKTLTVQMSNLTDWTWASHYFIPVTTTNLITLGSPVAVPTTSMSVAQSTFSFFGFGKTYQDDSAYYEQLATTNNETSIDFTNRGLGLPSATFLQFAELLRVATTGQATCVEQ